MRNKGVLVAGLAGAALFSAKVASAVPPPAGTVIGNVATATYYDENNNQYTSTSNLVQTTVKAVYAVDVTAQVPSVDATPGQILNIPFTVTNNGNAPDNFTLNATSTSDYVTIEGIYVDLNNNGVVDPGEEPVTEISAAMGESVPVIVVAQVSPDAPANTTAVVSLNATSTHDPNATDTDNTTVTVINDAVIQISMAVDKDVAAPGDTLTYTVSFANVGNQPANATEVTVDGETWEGIIVYAHVPDNTFLTDTAPEGTPTGGTVVYSLNGTSWTTTKLDNATYIGYFIPDDNKTDGSYTGVLDPDQQGSFIFEVQIVDNPTANEIVNNATIEYRLSDGQTNKTARSNDVLTTIPAEYTAAVDICCNSTATNVPAGSWVSFTHTVTNNGTNPDTINLDYDATNMPPGTVVEFWNADGTAKLIDTNGDGLIDVGELQPGENATITVKAYIPADTPASEANGVPDWNLIVKAISSINPDKYDQVNDTIDGVVASSVDIAKVGSAADGDQANDNITLQDNGTNGIKNIIYPGDSAIFPFEVVNVGGSSSAYSLSTSGLDVPNAVVTFYKDVNQNQELDADDVQITDTDLLGGTTLSQNASAGDTTLYVYSVANFNPDDVIYVGAGDANVEKHTVASVDVNNNTITLNEPLTNNWGKGSKVSETFYAIAKVDVPPETLAQLDNFTINATSTSANASDAMGAQLQVLEYYDIAVSPDNSAQIPPGGTVTYEHVVRNNSNNNATVVISLPTDTVLSYTILDDNKTAVGTTYTIEDMPPFSEKTFYVKVVAPTSVTPGTVEAIQVTAKIVDGNETLAEDYATDTTTIIEGYLQLTKYAKNATCGQDITEVAPGETICYVVNYKNIGTQNAYNVVITDPIPQYTTFVKNAFGTDQGLCLDANCDGVCDEIYTNAAGDDAAEYNNSTNAVVFRVGDNNTVAPGEEGCVIFKVQVNQ